MVVYASLYPFTGWRDQGVVPLAFLQAPLPQYWTGFDIAINATPIGMKEGDPHPIDSSCFTPDMFVGCVITAPAVPPMIAAARALGCNTLTGTEMFAQVKDLMVEFLMGK